MEKYNQDYAYHLNLAAYWFRLIGKDYRADQFHKAHLNWAQSINQEFKEISKGKNKKKLPRGN